MSGLCYNLVAVHNTQALERANNILTLCYIFSLSSRGGKRSVHWIIKYSAIILCNILPKSPSFLKSLISNTHRSWISTTHFHFIQAYIYTSTEHPDAQLWSMWALWSWFQLSAPTSISHWAENVFSDIQNAVSGLSVASNRMASTGILFDVLKQLIESLSDTSGSRAHLFQEDLVIGGPLWCLYTAFHWLGHQLACFNQLLLAHWGADGCSHHLDTQRKTSGYFHIQQENQSSKIPSKKAAVIQ